MSSWRWFPGDWMAYWKLLLFYYLLGVQRLSAQRGACPVFESLFENWAQWVRFSLAEDLSDPQRHQDRVFSAFAAWVQSDLLALKALEEILGLGAGLDPGAAARSFLILRYSLLSSNGFLGWLQSSLTLLLFCFYCFFLSPYKDLKYSVLSPLQLYWPFMDNKVDVRGVQEMAQRVGGHALYVGATGFIPALKGSLSNRWEL